MAGKEMGKAKKLKIKPRYVGTSSEDKKVIMNELVSHINRHQFPYMILSQEREL